MTHISSRATVAEERAFCYNKSGAKNADIYERTVITLLKRLSLRTMLGCFMAVAAFLTVFLGVYNEFEFHKDFYRQQVDYTCKMLSDACHQAQQKLSDVTKMLNQLSAKSRISSYCEMSALERMRVYEYIKILVDTYTETNSCVIALYLHSIDGTMVRSVYGFAGKDYHTLKGFYQVLSREALNVPFRKTKTGLVFEEGTALSAMDQKLYAISRPIFSESGYCGSLTIMLDIEKIMQDISENVQIPMLLRCGETVIWNSLSEEAESDEVSLYRQKLEASDWEITVPLYKSEVFEITDRVLNQDVITIMLVIATEAVLLILIYYWILRPLRDITLQMERIGAQNGKRLQRVYNASKSRNEMEVLANGINDMLIRVDELNQQAIKSKTDYQKEHIIFLQSQINPHFLFNSLSSIRGMAACGNTENVRAMAGNIAEIYRYCMSDDPIATVQEEIECVRQYVSVFELCYERRVQFRLDVDRRMLQCRIPRMILEPLVENAFSHGFVRSRPEEWQLELRGRILNGHLFIDLGNSGAVATEELLQRLNGILPIQPVYHGIGVSNVRSRIELIGGSSAYLQYRARERGGVIVTVCFPLEIEHMEERKL